MIVDMHVHIRLINGNQILIVVIFQNFVNVVNFPDFSCLHILTDFDEIL